MNVNSAKLRTMRDVYEEKYFGKTVVRSHDENIAEHFVVLSTLNALLRVANHLSNLDDIEKLTRTGRLIIENYEQAYNKKDDHEEV